MRCSLFAFPKKVRLKNGDIGTFRPREAITENSSTIIPSKTQARVGGFEVDSSPLHGSIWWNKDLITLACSILRKSHPHRYSHFPSLSSSAGISLLVPV